MKPKTLKKESVVSVDKFRLDEEWERQPKLYKRYADQLARAKTEVAEAKAELDVTKAELALNIRSEPKDYGFGSKPSEATVAECVIVQQEYRDALRAYILAKEKEELLKSTVDALDHRKKALEDLVYLWGRDYFSASIPPSKKRRIEESRVSKKDSGK